MPERVAATMSRTPREARASTHAHAKPPLGNQATLRRLQCGADSARAAEAVQQATVENGSIAPPGQAAYAAALDTTRMRDDAVADRSARLLGADAVAFGDEILFGRGRYEPNTGRGRALIAHELTHVAHQRETGRRRPQRSVSADVLTQMVTAAMAQAMTDDELYQQIQLVRAHLQVEPDDAGASENLATLEAEVEARQAKGQAPATPAAQAPPAVAQPEAAPQPAAPAQPAAQPAAPAAAANAPASGAVDVLQSTVTPDGAKAMSDAELARNIQVLRSRLQAAPDDAAASQNLATLEGEVSSRQPSGPAATPAAQAQAQDPAAADKAVAAMSEWDRLIEAYHRANIGQGVKAKIASMFTERALVAAIVSFAVVFLAAQLTPVGWAADLSLALTSLFLAGSVLAAMQHLVNFAAARTATTDADLTYAGSEFAAAVGEVAVDAVLLFLTHGLGGAKGGGGAPLQGPPAPNVALAFNRGGALVMVASNTITAEQAAQLGLQGAAASTSMMSAISGSGGGPGPQSQQPSAQQPTPAGPTQSTGGGPTAGATGVEIVDASGKPVGEFDEIAPDRFIEDKSATGLGTSNPRTGQPTQTADQWAQKQIFDKTVTRIENLLNTAVATRPTTGGSPVVPTLAQIQQIRQLEFRVEAATPDVVSAVQKQVQALTAKYPGWSFAATFGP